MLKDIKNHAKNARNPTNDHKKTLKIVLRNKFFDKFIKSVV